MGTSGLGALLVEDGLLTESDRRTIRRTCGGQGSSFARGVLATGLLDEDELAAFIAEKTRWKVAPKGLFSQSRKEVWGIIDRPLIERLEVLPLFSEGKVLHVAMVDPLDQDTLHQLAFFTGYKIAPVISTLTEIRAGLKKLLANYLPIKSQLEDFLENHASAASRRTRKAAGAVVKKAKAPPRPSFTTRPTNLESGAESSMSPASLAAEQWASPLPPPAAQAAPQASQAPQGAEDANMAPPALGADDLDFGADDDLFQEGGAAKAAADVAGATDGDLGDDLDDLDGALAGNSTGDADLDGASFDEVAGGPAAIDPSESLADLGDDIDNLSLDDVADDLFGGSKPSPPAPTGAAPAESSGLDFGAEGEGESEASADLSAFDTGSGGDETSDADLDFFAEDDSGTASPPTVASSPDLATLDDFADEGGDAAASKPQQAGSEMSVSDELDELDAFGESAGAPENAEPSLEMGDDELSAFGESAGTPASAEPSLEMGDDELSAFGESAGTPASAEPSLEMGDDELSAFGESAGAPENAEPSLEMGDDELSAFGESTGTPESAEPSLEMGDDELSAFGESTGTPESAEPDLASGLDLGDEADGLGAESVAFGGAEADHALRDELAGLGAAPDASLDGKDGQLAVDIDLSDPLLATPTAGDDAARQANAKRNRDLLRKLAGRKE
ncbi:MAG: hypothetical protein NTZ90_14540 [Proteobacteria bacterium]|nr:hypothetical protein [Pseudomonadota bacterium]